MRLVLLVVAASFLIAAPAHASFTSKVTVTTHELHAGECLDPVFLGCERPELRVDAVLDTNDGRQLVPCSGPTNASFENIVQDQIVCNGRPISGDFTVRVTLVDVDCTATVNAGCGPGVTAADLKAGPDQSWEVGPLRGGVASTTPVTTSGGPSWMSFTVTTEPVETKISIQQPAGSEGGTPVVRFDPTSGERVPFRATLTEPTQVEYGVIRRATGQFTELHRGPAWNTSVNLDWDGRGSAGLMPDGIYDLQLRDVANRGTAPVAKASRPVLLDRTPPTTVEARLNALTPAAAWDFRNGPITARGTITADGPLRLEVAERVTSCATFGTPVWQGPQTQRVRGPFELRWDGRAGSPGFVTPGDYCVRATLSGTVSSSALPLKVLPPATGLEAWAFPDPIVPIKVGPGPTTATINAMVVDTAHRNRFASRVTIEASPAGPPGQPIAAAPQTVATCERAESCTASLPASIASARAVAYRVTATEASDAPGGPATFTSPWRITDLNPLPLRTWRASAPGVLGPDGFVTPPVSSTLDVAYYPGSGNDLTMPAQASRFAVQVTRNIKHLFGLGTAARGPTSLAAGAATVSFIVSPQGVVDVRGTGPQICEWSGLVPVSYAEANGVLHHAECRDVSYPHSREYSSDNPETDWHELHHMLYGESDEYCCDGGYSDGVNAYNSLSSCTAKSSPGATCARVFDILAAAPGTASQTSWFRGDPVPDVMVQNQLVENPDDLRAAAATFARCASGRC